MLEVFKKIWKFAGNERKEIGKSIVLSFFFAVFYMVQIGAVYFVIKAMTDGSGGLGTALTSLALIVISIGGRAVTNRFAQLQQTHAGYFMAADKRMYIGSKLKTVPMGYFNSKSLGEITGISTTVLDDIQNVAPMVLVGILSGFVNAVVFTAMVLIFDWRIGILVVTGTIVYLLITSAMEKKSASAAPKRQESEAKMVESVLEQIQGMSVIKSFNLTGKGDKKVRNALEYNRESNIEIEKLFTPFVAAQEIILHLFSVFIMAAAVLLWTGGTMSLADGLMTVIISFLVFAQIESAGSGMALMRVVGSSIDHTEQIEKIPQMDDGGRNISPEDHGIIFDKVKFSYGKRKILDNISFSVPQKTSTAIVGPSGSGKTTMCSLIARFWDVDGGSIKLGGIDIREYTLESLMDQISMVFQNVYLFADTIENNIKFGRPGASREQVIQAAEKACCHDFIEALPEGYDTVIGEGGANLSGGERQRISIARALLKDAPVIIFDEATANVDPENEDKLQKAMEALTEDKTVIMIAHRLKTVKNADQIFVIDKGRIVQHGTHGQLEGKDGLYRNFISERNISEGWKIKR